MTDASSHPAPLPRARRCPLDPPEEYAALRRADPVSRLAFPDGSAGWLVTRYDDVRTVLTDPRFSARGDLVTSPVASQLRRRDAPAPGMFARMDPPDHTRYRRLLARHFHVRRVRALVPVIERIVAGRLDALRRAGPPADLVELFALPVPTLVICELLGVPYEDRAAFQSWTASMVSVDSTREESDAAVAALAGYVRTLVVAKRGAPADDLLADLAADGELTDEETANIGLSVLVAGHETTANMLSLGAFALLRHPGELAAFRADPGLTEQAVEELLRYLTIPQFGRERAALEDVVLGGRTIAAGEVVVASLLSANRDPGRFDDPDTLDLRRPPAGHLAFGHGIHQCIGQQLAREQLRAGLRALFTQGPTLRLAVPPEEVPMCEDSLNYGVRRLPVTWDTDR
ncbi:cytochrome P450 [Streptomyces decoyicus]|uniref:PtmO5 n=1 Tax=Streptomyces sp. CB00765 TaxID=1489680 RepID=A0A0A0V083_9ACTN|nr:ptmO5 [Streptomyces sp. CB00765]